MAAETAGKDGSGRRGDSERSAPTGFFFHALASSVSDEKTKKGMKNSEMQPADYINAAHRQLNLQQIKFPASQSMKILLTYISLR